MKRLLPILLLVFSAQVDAWNPKDLARLKATNECEECDLGGANLSRPKHSIFFLNLHEKPKGIDLRWAKLAGADLKEANLYKANLRMANLPGANLAGVRLYKAQLEGANMKGVHLIGADLYKANLKWTNLEGANLKKAYLYKANLYKANLFRAGLKVTNLFRVDLSRANLTEANLEDALHFETVNTTGAIFCRTVMPNGSTKNSGCSQ
jgi:uncharacterized protein YjbI with pentapeptide repeats